MQFKLLNEAVWEHDNLTNHFLKHCLDDPAAGDSHDNARTLMRGYGCGIGAYHRAKDAYAHDAEELSNAPAENISADTEMQPGVVYGYIGSSPRGNRYIKARLSNDHTMVDTVTYGMDDVIISYYRMPVRKFMEKNLAKKVEDINPAKPEESVEEVAPE